jgi:hypothetical protein
MEPLEWPSRITMAVASTEVTLSGFPQQPQEYETGVTGLAVAMRTRQGRLAGARTVLRQLARGAIGRSYANDATVRVLGVEREQWWRVRRLLILSPEHPPTNRASG